MAKQAKTVPPTPPEAAGTQPLPRLQERRGATKAPLDFSHLVTEDGAPVENRFSEVQMVLLRDAITASWPYPERPVLVCADVGLFSDTEPVMAPDVMLAVEVEGVPTALTDKTKAGRSYFVSLYGKAPDVVVEIVSNDEGGEMEKLPRYARLGVRYAVIFDPGHFLSAHTMRAFSLRTDGTARESHSRVRFWMPHVGLGLTCWQGRYVKEFTMWLRWCDRGGNILPTGLETSAEAKAETARERTLRLAEQRRAEGAEAEAARERTLRLAEQRRAEGAEAETVRERTLRLAEQRRAEGAEAEAERLRDQAARYAQKLRESGVELQ